MTDYQNLYIGGEWRQPAGNDRLVVHNPATGEVIGSTPEGTATDIDAAVDAARAALVSGPWAGASAAERSECIGRILQPSDRAVRRPRQSDHCRG